MAVVQAVLVMRQHVDDAALGNAAFAAGFDHVLDLAPECGEPFDPTSDALQVLARERVDLGA